MTSADSIILNIKHNKLYFKLVLQCVPDNTFLLELSQLVLDVKNNIIFVGDVNINLLNNNGTTQNYNGIMNNNGLISLINGPTRITRKSKALIDHIFVRSRCLKHFSSGIFDFGNH